VVAERAHAATATRTSLSSSTSSTLLGQFVTLTAKVQTASGASVTSGNVRFYNGSTLLAEVAVTHTGHATSYSNALFTGSYDITAKYTTNAQYSTSKSKGVSLSVNMPRLKAIGSGGLQYAVVQAGSGGSAQTGHTLTVDYIGYLTDGTVIGSSTQDGQAFQFLLGNPDIIAGWNRGVVGMKIGETRVLEIPPALAYGNNPPPGVPKNAMLIYVIDLLSIDS
jgi:hypothetical protein